MAQGCNKTGQKGTNTMFVMTHDKIRHPLAAKKFFTYANPVVDYWPQNANTLHPHHSWGQLDHTQQRCIVRTADIDTAKLHLNSVISTKEAKYMCLDIKNFYLMASLKYFEYMYIPLLLFPAWTIEQYNLTRLALDGWVHIEMQKSSAGLTASRFPGQQTAPT